MNCPKYELVQLNFQNVNIWHYLTFCNSIEAHQCLSDNPRYVRELTLIFLPLILGMRFTQILSIRTGESIRTEKKSILRVEAAFLMLLAFLKIHALQNSDLGQFIHHITYHI